MDDRPYYLPEAEPVPAIRPRIAKLNSLVMKEVAATMARQVELPPGVVVTISRVKVADDAETAKVWISVLPADQASTALAAIEKQISDIQHTLNRRLFMKFVPKLMFRLDDGPDRADRINRVLDSLK